MVIRDQSSSSTIFYIVQLYNMNKSKSKDKGNKSIGKKDKDKMREKHRRQLEDAKIEEERQSAKNQIQGLKRTGLVTAYQQFLRNICKNGLPESNNVYELAAQFVLKYEKKMKQKQIKKSELIQFNSEALRSINPKKDRAQSPSKSISSRRH